LIGNKDCYESAALLGMSGRLHAGQSVRDWIFPSRGRRSTRHEQQSMDVLMSVSSRLPRNDYNAINENDASAAFAQGQGAFLISAATGKAHVILAGLKRSGFMAIPSARAAMSPAIGATSLPCAHLGQEQVSRTWNAALINWLITAPVRRSHVRTEPDPAVLTAPPRRATRNLTRSRRWQKLVRPPPDSLPDWSSDTMLNHHGD